MITSNLDYLKTLFTTYLLHHTTLNSLNLDHSNLNYINLISIISDLRIFTEKNGFVTATNLGTTNKNFVAATKNFAAATKRFVDRTKHFVVVTKYFCYLYFNK